MVYADLDAFDTNINNCLFWRWTTYGAGKGNKAVLNKLVNCEEKKGRLQGRCYGTPWPTDPMKRKEHRAQFAVCYDTYTRIPKFTGHVLKPGVLEGARGLEGDYVFHADASFGGK